VSSCGPASAPRSLRFAPRGIGARLLALALVAVAPVFALAAWLVHSNELRSQQLAEYAALDIAHTVGAGTQEFLDASARALATVAAMTSFAPDGRIRCEPLMQRLSTILPRLTNVVVFERSGALACTMQQYAADAFRPVGGEPWFRQTLEGRRPVLSPPFKSQITGRWISAHTYPIVDNDATVRGVTGVAIDLETLRPGGAAFDLPPGQIAGIVHDDGTIVSRSHDAARWIGKSIRSPLRLVQQSAHESRTTTTVGIDGVERVYAFTRVPGTPWFAYAGIAADPLRAAQRRTRDSLYLAILAIALIAAAGALLMARSIAKPIRAMAEVARAVAAGNSDSRVPVDGPLEMREVAAEFNRMVEIRQRTEADLMQMAQTLRALSQRLVEAEESERRAMHRELHDRIGQNLAALSIDLHILRAQLPASEHSATRLDNAAATVRATIADVRNLMAELRPPALDDYGLAPALRAFCHAFASRSGVHVECAAEDLAQRPRAVVEMALFRITQEAATNIAKHAHARRVDVTLAMGEDGLTLSIVDDGRGFDAAGPRAQPSWGLSMMRERADAVGATLHIESRPGGGTSVVVQVPRASLTARDDEAQRGRT
jgi:signal transduction histidine kinase